MDTIVLKFGGSSVADTIKLNIVAQKVIEYYQKGNKIVVVVSAQGKTTDKLIEQAKELSTIPNDREMDVLLSTGEQISMSKLSILLNELGYPAISLTGWQAGIYTNEQNQSATIEHIETDRIEAELEKGNIVIVAGFQGINKKEDITTLGRGGSDTTAVALAAALNAKQCYIFSDVDGVYSTDPNKITQAKKLEALSYNEMLEISSEGAKVLHNRCVEIAQKYQIPIITKSTFNNKPGSIVQEKMEDTNVKSIVKNDDILFVTLKYETYSNKFVHLIQKTLIEYGIKVNHFINLSNYSLVVHFLMPANQLNKYQKLLKQELSMFTSTFYPVSRIAVVGYGIQKNTSVLQKILNLLEKNDIEVISIEQSELKIAIVLKETVSNRLLEQLHQELI